MKRLTASQVQQRAGLADWRVVGGTLQGRFVAASFADGARFASDVAAAADAADHHPDIDLRYPGSVVISLSTHVAGGLTELDVSMATTISALAAEASLRSEPALAEVLEIAIDALDVDAVRPFWAAVLDYRNGPIDEDGVLRTLRDPRRRGPDVWFQQMDRPRPQRNRFHLDVWVPHDQATARVAAAVAAGATLLSDRAAPSFWVLADAEGNEACVSSWEGRDPE